MPEHIRALIVILFLATVVFAFAHRSACAISEPENFIRRRNLWFALTLAAFVAQNFWLYSLIAVLLLIYTSRRENNPAALYFSMMFVLPMAIVQIPGMGLVNFLFDLTHLRILALIVLLPVYFSLLRDTDNISFGRSGPDKALAAYLLLVIVLSLLREASMTNTLRHVFYLFTDIFLPYFVISRSIKNMQAFRDAITSFVMVLMVMAAIALFEFLKHWLLYAPVLTSLGMQEGMTEYLGRDGRLRVTASAGQPIVLGYLMTVGIGLYLYLQKNILQQFARRAGMVLLSAGLIVPLSRGPWVGAAALVFVYIASGRKPLRRLMNAALLGMLVFSLLAVLPGGERMINLLPFVGATEKGNIDYRENLITNSMIVIERNLWFGSIDFLETPEMEAMRQGQGIIDLVNSYIVVALKTGVVGLALFACFFALVLKNIYRSMRSVADKDSEEYLLGRVLLSTLLAILLMIMTVSSIAFIPIVYWSVAAMGMAYTNMLRKNTVKT